MGFLRGPSCPSWLMPLSFGLLGWFSVFLLHPDHGDLSESLLKRRGLELGSHPPHHIFRNNPIAPLMPIDANLQRNIEEHGMHFVVVVFGEFDPVLALLRRQVGGVHVIHRALGDQPRLQHRAEIGEHQILETLLADVIKQERPHHVT